ncbi:MAG: hypothetical protein GY938_14990 [Ketobacter sp.]|nr:hypothetical protein [Ketobacter sp.]
MKKALQRPNKAFLYEKGGKVMPEEVCIEEVIAAVNRGISDMWDVTNPETVVFRRLHDWICRYIEEGPTDAFFDDLNSNLRHIRYSNYVVPPGFFSSDLQQPTSAYVANMNIEYPPEILAAKEVSRFVTYGMLEKIKRCKLQECENLFVGPPQSKWCSKSCGSRYRVTKKRKKDAS